MGVGFQQPKVNDIRGRCMRKANCETHAQREREKMINDMVKYLGRTAWARLMLCLSPGGADWQGDVGESNRETERWKRGEEAHLQKECVQQ